MKTVLQSLLTLLCVSCLFTTKAQTSTVRWIRNEKPTVLKPQLTAFAAVETGNSVSLNWATSAEKNSSYFIVERSRDGIQFDSAGAVTALGRFDLPTSYEFTDLQPVADSKYYRLRIVELDGTQDYWKACKVTSVRELSDSRRSVAGIPVLN